MKKTLLLFTLSAVAGAVNANILMERDPNQTNVDIKPVTDQAIAARDLLRMQGLSQQQQLQKEQVTHYTGRELMDNPRLLEDLFLQALITRNKKILPVYIQLYEKSPDQEKDASLVDWANAILQTDTDLTQSVSSYRALISSFPNNHFIRYQLAEVLFYNQEYEAAKTQFEKLRSTSVNPKDLELFDNFINAINSKSQWNISFGATFLNDKNLSNAPKVGTTASLPNGSFVTYTSPRQEGQGFSAWMGANRQWNLSNGKYTLLNTNLSSKYYWNNKRYNEINGYLGWGFGFANARFNISLEPYLMKRWYAGGVNSSESLKRYTNTYGLSFSSSYWLNKNFKYSFNYSYGYEAYEKKSYSQLYNGASNSISNSLMYLPSPTQYWSISVDWTHKNAKDKTNAFSRIGTRLTWGQEWPFGLSSSATFGIAKRDYREASFFGKKQKNREYSASISLWHKKLHYAGFTPRITWSYTRTASNIEIYSYDKNQIFFELSRSF